MGQVWGLTQEHPYQRRGLRTGNSCLQATGPGLIPLTVQNGLMGVDSGWALGGQLGTHRGP